MSFDVLLKTVADKLKWLCLKVKSLAVCANNKWNKISDDIKVLIICFSILLIFVMAAVLVKIPHEKPRVVSGQPYIISTGIGNELTLTFGGDIMCHDGQLLDAKQENETYNFMKCFEEISPIIEKADIAIANLEGTVTTEEQSPYGYPYYYMPEEFADALSETGFNILSINNAQCANAGEIGITHTKEYLSGVGVSAFGTDKKPLVIEGKGIRVGIVAAADPKYLSSVENGDAAKEFLNIMSKEQLRKDIEYCKEKGSDIVIAYLRWGVENNNVPTSEMREFAKYLVSMGTDIIIGGGSHTVMPMEIIDTDDAYDISKVRKGYVFYSLGNFISNQRTNSGDMGALATVTIRKISAGTTRVVKYETVPVYTNVDIADGRNFQVLPVYPDSVVPEWMDETNKNRFIKVYSIVDTVLHSLDVSDRSK